MRKAFARTLALVMTMAVVLTGCGSSGDKSSTNTSASGSGSATNWLKDTVTMVVPYSAGGDTDTYCRQMSKLLGEKLGVNFVVVNTTGGSGVVASSSVLNAKNDGSTADRLTAFMANQCDVLVVNYMNIAGYVENGDFVVMGICPDERLPGLEDIPTLKEQGYDVVQPKLYEVRMPKGTDQSIVDKLSAAMAEIAEDPSFQETLSTYYAQAYYRNGADTISGDTELVNELKDFFAES